MSGEMQWNGDVLLGFQPDRWSGSRCSGLFVAHQLGEHGRLLRRQERCCVARFMPYSTDGMPIRALERALGNTIPVATGRLVGRDLGAQLFGFDLFGLDCARSGACAVGRDCKRATVAQEKVQTHQLTQQLGAVCLALGHAVN